MVADEADLVIRHSRKYLQMLDLTERKLVIACGQGELTPGMLPDLESLPDGLVGRFDTIVALRSTDDSAIKEACSFIRSIFAGDDASAEDRPAATEVALPASASRSGAHARCMAKLVASRS